MNQFSLFVALRYLRSKRQTAALSLAAVMSVAGIAAGVMAMVLAIAINNGFRRSLERNLLGATPHVLLLEKQPGAGISDWRALIAKLKTLQHVQTAEPALYGKVLASGPLQAAETTLKGVPPSSPVLAHILKSGSLQNLKQDRGLRGVALGVPLAQRLGLKPGDVVTLISPQGELTPFGPRAAQYRFRVTATFESGFYDLDNQFAFTTLENAQQIFQTGDVVNALELRIDNLDAAPAIAKLAEALAPKELAGTHWMEQNRQVIGALRMEKTVSLVTIGLIQLVAALNILTALAMMVLEKKREIAILLSLGARASQVSRVFLLQGLILGAAGVVLGLTLGYGLSFLADRYRWISLDAELYSMAYVPFEPRAFDALWISAAALAVSLLASIQPARSAARIMPVETLRYE